MIELLPLYTILAIVLVFAALHITAGAILAAPDAPSAALNPEVAPQQGDIGLVLGTLFLLILAAVFSVGVVIMNSAPARLPVVMTLLVSAVFGLVYGVNDGKRKRKAGIKSVMNGYLNVYFSALSIYYIWKLIR